jgi:hypothetical protein
MLDENPHAAPLFSTDRPAGRRHDDRSALLTKREQATASAQGAVASPGKIALGSGTRVYTRLRRGLGAITDTAGVGGSSKNPARAQCR